MLSHPSCCNFPLLGNLFQQVVIELDYSVSKSHTLRLNYISNLAHALRISELSFTNTDDTD